MGINFNVAPYFDDFDPSKNYHRILFKPGFAVQGRELTQSQTILQNQITSFADNIFQQNSPVTGAQVSTSFDVSYIKLQATYAGVNIDVDQWNDLLISNLDGTVLARVVAVAQASSNSIVDADPPTLIVTYKSGKKFQDNDLILDTGSSLTAQAIPVDATGLSSVVSIDTGVFYVVGNFVQVNPQTIILSKYTNTPTLRVGLNISEEIYKYTNDPSLLDPALGSSNYQAPGADRYKISLTLTTRPIEFGDDSNFIQLLRIDEGKTYKLVDGSVYSVIDDYFAKRDYETNGDYVVNDFKLTPKTDAEANNYIMNVGKGLAYVRGYRVENPAPLDIISPRARDTNSLDGVSVFTDYGSFVYTDTIQGYRNLSFDPTQSQFVDIHCVRYSTSNVVTSSSTTYEKTLIGTAMLRGLTFEGSPAGDGDTLAYVYKTYICNFEGNTLTGSSTGSTDNTITLPSDFSYVNDAYYGVSITITSGINAGETKTITAYNGNTKVATVNSDWSINPPSGSNFSLNFAIKDAESIIVTDRQTIGGTVAVDGRSGFIGVRARAGTVNVPDTGSVVHVNGRASIVDVAVNGSGYIIVFPRNAIAQILVDASANINAAQGKVKGLPNGDTILSNPLTPELLWPVGNPYVSYLGQTSYPSAQTFRNIQFTSYGSGCSATLSYVGDFKGVVQFVGEPNTPLDISVIKENYTIINTTTGQIIPWTSPNSAVISGDGSSAQGSTITFVSPTLLPFTATIIAKVIINNADNTSHVLKIKNLVNANTSTANGWTSGTQVIPGSVWVDDSVNSSGQIYIKNDSFTINGPQSLYLSDAKLVVKIIDTLDPTVDPTDEMLINPQNDITSRFSFDNGQRDNFYDHASITLNPGSSAPIGNILIFVNYYKHSGGDGYFSKMSYIDVSSSREDYRQIPSYTSRYGKFYYLRDCIDFRPTRTNATTSFAYNYSNPALSNYGTYIPTDLSVFRTDYSYYLGRKDKLVLTKDKTIEIIYGTPAISPVLPSEPDGSLVLANLTLNPYTGYIPTETPAGFLADLSVERVQHQRFTMSDIADLESRISRVEYYSSLNALEQATSSLQIPDAFGLNRFKNGILVDDFSSFGTVDTASVDFSANINRRTRQMTALQTVKNFPMSASVLAYNLGNPSASLLNSIDYKITKDNNVNYFTLPYTESSIIEQRLASGYVNINPFSVSTYEGVLTVSPNVDNWVDTDYAPSLLIIDPNLQVYQQTQELNVLKAGDWQTIGGTSYLAGTSYVQQVTTNATYENFGKFNGPFGTWYGYAENTLSTIITDTYNVTNKQQQNNLLGPYSSIGNTYALNNGYITDISVLPWIRKQEMAIAVDGLLINDDIHNFFDNVNVDKYVRNANIIELSNVVGQFNPGDVIGYVIADSFSVTGRVLGVYDYMGSGNTRLYIAADGNTQEYANTTVGNVIRNAFFDEDGHWPVNSNTAFGVVQSWSRVAGSISQNVSSTSTNSIYLGNLATYNASNTAASNTAYVGNTFYITSGTVPGQSATIVSYDSVTRTANLSSNLTISYGDIWSLGGFETNEEGSFYGVFCLPPNKFHTGERIFRIDNRVGNNIETVTSFAEGSFYAQGLQATKQDIDFAASPAGAKGTFIQTNSRNVSFTRSVTTTLNQEFISAWDPLAQTFIIDPTNYPNGAFLSSARFFFKNKPTKDTAPVTLSIVGTLNGYPNGTTLDHSIISLSPDKVKVSETPQYLDSTTYTEFTFNSPVFIQPNVLYSFILKSSSKEYELWTASNGLQALASSVKNLPTDPDPTSITKISTAPYVGALFVSQNAQTWTADQNQSLMFVVNRCKFDTTARPNVKFIVPKNLPSRTLIDSSVDYFNNNISTNSSTSLTTSNNVLVDAFNMTTTDLIPTQTNINYSYQSSLANGVFDTVKPLTPGKYGTTMYDHVYLDDGLGERMLVANSTSTLSMFAQMYSTSDAVSPVISDAGLSSYVIQFDINNCELSNNVINILNKGSQYYNVANISITVDPPTGKNGIQATLGATSSNITGEITSIYVTNPGAGYLQTPNVSVVYYGTDRTSTDNVQVMITGETSSRGGPADARYVSKKVVLASGFESGDLNVYMTAYRPVGTDITVYYKILNSDDTQLFEDGNWQQMIKTKNSDTLYSSAISNLYEFTFAPGQIGDELRNNYNGQGYVSYTSTTTGQTYNTFNQFAIKIVLTTTDKTNVPFLSDLRCIALPSDT